MVDLFQTATEVIAGLDSAAMSDAEKLAVCKLACNAFQSRLDTLVIIGREQKRVEASMRREAAAFGRPSKTRNPKKAGV